MIHASFMFRIAVGVSGVLIIAPISPDAGRTL
jgi:hypothetical protein